MIKARSAGTLFILVLALAISGLISDSGLGTESPARTAQVSSSGSFTGSVSCRKSHGKFYQLWAPSHHGLAMQPYTTELAYSKLMPQKEDIIIGSHRYRADISGDTGWIIEQAPEGERKYRIDLAMSGLIRQFPAYADAYLLLGQILEQQGNHSEAERVYRTDLTVQQLPSQARGVMKERLDSLKTGASDVKKK